MSLRCQLSRAAFWRGSEGGVRGRETESGAKRSTVERCSGGMRVAARAVWADAARLPSCAASWSHPVATIPICTLITDSCVCMSLWSADARLSAGLNSMDGAAALGIEKREGCELSLCSQRLFLF